MRECTAGIRAQAKPRKACGEHGKASSEGNGRVHVVLVRSAFLHALSVSLIAAAVVLSRLPAHLVLPVAVRRVIDFGFTGENSALVNSYFSMLVLVAAVLAAASALRFYCVSWLGERAVSDIRHSVFAHLTTLSPAFYEQTHSAELMSRLTADTTQSRCDFHAFSHARRNMRC